MHVYLHCMCVCVCCVPAPEAFIPSGMMLHGMDPL